MKIRRMMKENKGYSLVEMIIVIAIIAVMSAGALVTVSLTNSARAKEAGVTFDSEVSSLIAKSKSQVVKFKLDSEATATEHKDYYFAITVYEDGGRYYIANGYYNSTTGEFRTYDCENVNSGKGKSLSNRVAVNYEPGNKNDGSMAVYIRETQADGSTAYYTRNNAYVIAFDKSGRCVSGVGTYEFSKAADKAVLDVVTINANGSHQSK